MPNIVLSRIDERLIHGQVGVQWVGFAGANLVLVANDEVAEDPVQQNLMEMVLAEGIAVRFWSLQKVIDNIHRAADRQKILLVCKSPADFYAGRRRRSRHTYQRRKHALRQWQTTNCQNGFCRRERYHAFNGLKAAGVECFVQGVPTEPALDLFKLL
jgi:PTS system N-acetylgalactosamine-specific IIB component